MKRLTIAGGGLAGLILGLRLRELNVPVSVIEAGFYPRHRVCGEFICGSGIEVLERMGLENRVQAVPARTVRFYDRDRLLFATELPEPAWCVSRHRLDKLLADELASKGGDIRFGKRFDGDLNSEGLVSATGRRRANGFGHAHGLGLKVHCTRLETEADLEVHWTGEGYVGLCPVGEGVVNACGFFRLRSGTSDVRRRWLAQLLAPDGSLLADRARRAEIREDSFCAVAGVAPAWRMQRARNECRIGDASAMIAPLTGNGMSMAIEAGELAAEPLALYARSALDWESACWKVHSECRLRFGRRLLWSALLHGSLFHKLPSCIFVRSAARWPSLFHLFFSRTR